MSKALTFRDKFSQVIAQVESRKDRILQSMPNGAAQDTVDRFVRGVEQCLAKTPRLLDDVPGVIAACYAAARLGLDPAPAMQHLAIVPFAGKAVLMVQYQGMAHIMWERAGITASAEAIYKYDDLEYWESDKGTHFRWTPEQRKDRGPLAGAWARLSFPDGRVLFRYLGKWQVEAVKKQALSRTKKDSPWTGPFEAEMWRKTALKSVFKLAPKSGSLAALQDHMADEDAPEIKEARAVVRSVKGADLEMPEMDTDLLDAEGSEIVSKPPEPTGAEEHPIATLAGKGSKVKLIAYISTTREALTEIDAYLSSRGSPMLSELDVGALRDLLEGIMDKAEQLGIKLPNP